MTNKIDKASASSEKFGKSHADPRQGLETDERNARREDPRANNDSIGGDEEE